MLINLISVAMMLFTFNVLKTNQTHKLID